MALAAVLLTILALPIGLCAWSAWSLSVNRAKVDKVGLPIFTRWIALTNPFWMMFGSSIVRRCRALGIGTPNFWRFYMFAWEANDRYRIHQELGKVFMQVTPGGNWVSISDPEVIDDIIRRPKDFRRNMDQFEVVNVYGKNLSTTDGDEWKKHRKVTAVTFTEKNNELVWRQTLAQAKGMLEYWIEHQPIRTLGEDTKVFTLNVLAAAVFNKSYPFEGSAAATTGAHARDESYEYRDSMSKLLNYVIPIYIFGEKGLKAWWVPKSWKQAGEAVSTFRSYVMALINEERDNMSRGIQDNQNLVAALVRACAAEGEDEPSHSEKPRKLTLTEQEIISNLFVFGFAGNDTTAVSLTHLITFLAAHPQSQDWIAEEARYYLPKDDPTQWSYSTFPKLKRCLAVMMESLRLCHPLGQLVKITSEAQTIKVDGRTHTIPAGTSIHLSMSAIHTDPRLWGSDSMQFNPRRFISRPTDTAHGLENETLASDTSAHFLPWAYGQRVCPGKRFSQVETVAAIAVLFRNHTVEPLPMKGESMEQARKRIFEAGLDIEHEGRILHEMRDPASVGLVWKRRSG